MKKFNPSKKKLIEDIRVISLNPDSREAVMLRERWKIRFRMSDMIMAGTNPIQEGLNAASSVIRHTGTLWR